MCNSLHLLTPILLSLFLHGSEKEKSKIKMSTGLVLWRPPFWACRGLLLAGSSRFLGPVWLSSLMTTFGVHCLQGPVPSVSESPIRRPWGLGFHVFYPGTSHHCSVPGLHPCWVSCRHLAPRRASLHHMANGTGALSAETSLSPPPAQLSAVQFHSHVRLFATPWSVADQASLSITQLQGLAQTHVHWVTDAIQPSHPLSSPSPLTFNPSQHQGLFKWVSSSHQVAKVLEFQLQHQSFQWTFRTDFL